MKTLIQTLVLGSLKGGCGKTTAAVNIAVWLACEGVDVLLLDSDPQRSSTKCIARRLALHAEAPLPKVHCLQISDDVSAAIEDAKTRYDVVLVDAPGLDSPELRSSLLVCDAFITPSQASIFDLETLNPLGAVVARSRMYNKALKAYILLSRAPTNVMIREVEDARELVSDLPGFVLLDTVIRERKAYRDGAIIGKGVVEMDNSQAKAEVQLLCQGLFPELQAAQRVSQP